jgi:CDP-diacylglycerol--glycerol-3-phosphate 3-phosphatidyltransferase
MISSRRPSASLGKMSTKEESTLSQDKPKPSLASIANQLTTLRLLLSFVLFYAIAIQAWRAALVLFAIASITDWLDGYFARLQNQVTSFGRMYDPLIDKVLVCGVFIFLIPEPDAGIAPWMVTAIVAREFLVTGIRGFLEEQGISFGADKLGKIKMVLQCVAILWIFLMFDQNWLALDQSWPRWTRDGLNAGMLAATILSGLNYLRRALPHLF